MHPLDNDQKVTVLLAALEERYKATHAIRERVQSMGIWAIGLMLAAGGWIIQNDLVLLPYQKVFFVVTIMAAFIILRFRYLSNLHLGFQGQQRAMVRIEKALGLFSTDVFDTENAPLYEATWQHAGSKKGGGKFFETAYILLYIGVGFLIGAILLSY